MAQIPIHPVSQLNQPTLDGQVDENRLFNCVPTCIAVAVQAVTGNFRPPDWWKDRAYGQGYVGGTAARDYVSIAEGLGAKLESIDGAPGELVAAIHREIAIGHPCMGTEPDPYSSTPGLSHVVLFYEEEPGRLTVMDPFYGQSITRSDSEWSNILEFNEVWRIEAMAGVPQGWTDDGKILHAPNGVPIVLGFRDYILQNPWDAENWPLEPERAAQPVEDSNAQLGNGTRQTFRLGILEWTPAKGVFVGWIGQELLKVLAELEAARSAPNTAKQIASEAIALLQKI